MDDKKINKRSIWVNPCLDCDCGCTEDGEDINRFIYEIPGVDKKNITLKVTKDALRMVASLDDIEYVNEYPFVCEADPEGVEASYKNGVLTVDVPFKCPDPFRDAQPVKIS
jgi:HSP20 family molecular chaperone IbpA